MGVDILCLDKRAGNQFKFSTRKVNRSELRSAVLQQLRSKIMDYLRDYRNLGALQDLTPNSKVSGDLADFLANYQALLYSGLSRLMTGNLVNLVAKGQGIKRVKDTEVSNSDKLSETFLSSELRLVLAIAPAYLDVARMLEYTGSIMDKEVMMRVSDLVASVKIGYPLLYTQLVDKYGELQVVNLINELILSISDWYGMHILASLKDVGATKGYTGKYIVFRGLLLNYDLECLEKALKALDFSKFWFDANWDKVGGAGNVKG